MDMMRGLNKLPGKPKYFDISALGNYAVEVIKCFKKVVGRDTQIPNGPESFLTEVKILESDAENSSISVGDIVSVIKRPHGAQTKFALEEIRDFVYAAYASKEGVDVNQVDITDEKSVAVVENNALEGTKLLLTVAPARNPEYTKLVFRPVSG